MAWFKRSSDMAILKENETLRRRLADLESRLALQMKAHAEQVNAIVRLRRGLFDARISIDYALTERKPEVGDV